MESILGKTSLKIQKYSIKKHWNLYGKIILKNKAISLKYKKKYRCPIKFCKSISCNKYLENLKKGKRSFWH